MKERYHQLDLAKTVKAQGVNLDRASIAKIENGLRCVLDYELAAIAKACDVSINRIVS